MIRLVGLKNGSPTDVVEGPAPAPDVVRPTTELDLARLEGFLREQAAPNFGMFGVKLKSGYKHAALVLKALAGKPLVPAHEERNRIWYQSFAGTVADMLARHDADPKAFGDVETEVLAEALVALFAPCLQAQIDQDHAAERAGGRSHSALDSERVFDMFCRSLRDRRATFDRLRAVETKKDEMLGTMSRPTEAAAPAPKDSLLTKLRGAIRG